MEVKFFEGLFEGDSPVGVRLGMGLTGGDFWPRSNGCVLVYRAEDVEAACIDGIVLVCDAGEQMFALPEGLLHDPEAGYVYLVRCCNGCGDEAADFNGAIRVAFDAAGELLTPPCSRILNLSVQVVPGPACLVGWEYDTLGQGRRPVGFAVDVEAGGAWSSAGAQIRYVGPGVYAASIPIESSGVYRFRVRIVDGSGDAPLSAETSIQIAPAGDGELLGLELTRE